MMADENDYPTEQQDEAKTKKAKADKAAAEAAAAASAEPPVPSQEEADSIKEGVYGEARDVKAQTSKSSYKTR